MSNNLIEYKCPCCNAPLHFNPQLQKIKCNSCGNVYTAKQLEDYKLGKEIVDIAKQPSKIDWDLQSYKESHQKVEETNGYVCESCGAEIIADENTVATECMYCGNKVVIKQKISGVVKPDFVIPFKLDKKAAKNKLKQFYKNKILLPKAFKDENRIEKIAGMYIPFWFFDCEGEGFVTFKATRSRHWEDSEYSHTTTYHYLCTRAGELAFEKIPVDASSKMEDDYMDGLEPYDYSEIKDFTALYLAGYFADKYDVSVEETIPRADLRVKNSTFAALRKTVVGYETVMPADSNIQMEKGNIQYGLLPVWMLNTKYHDKMYQFAINGQTGRISGLLPIDKKRAVLLFLAVFLISACSIAIIAYFIVM